MQKNKKKTAVISPVSPTKGEEPIQVMEINALYRIVGLISSAVHLDTALSAILKVLHDTLQMERATLALLDDNNHQLVIRASYGLSVEEEQRGIYGLEEGISGQVFSTASPFIVPDVHQEPLFLNRTGARNTLGKNKIAFIGVPVILGGTPVGVLSVDRLFGLNVSLKEDVHFLTVVATLIAQFLSLNRAITRDRRKLLQENSTLKAKLHIRFRKHYIIGHSKPMQEVFRTIEHVAPSKATVLLMGESGTGKELVAQAIHEASPRRKQPFIKLNCAALPETLLESELFGHERGAFTGAEANRVGRFELADKGTLFLDEIGEIPMLLQGKLLRVLQEQEFERLGSTKTLRVDVRIIAATNVDLEKAIAAGTFRSDLYYRLNVVPMVLPPLRKRIGDVPLLLNHFLQASNLRNQCNIRISKKFLDTVQNYNWPGNVRELQNLIERLVILAVDDLLQPEDLPDYFFNSGNPDVQVDYSQNPTPNRQEIVQESLHTDTHTSLQDLEKEQVQRALDRHGWVQARAARELGLTQRQIGYRIKKFNLVNPHITHKS